MANSARYNDHFSKLDPTEVYPEIWTTPHVTPAPRLPRLMITRAPTVRELVADFDETGRIAK